MSITKFKIGDLIASAGGRRFFSVMFYMVFVLAGIVLVERCGFQTGPFISAAELVSRVVLGFIAVNTGQKWVEAKYGKKNGGDDV